MECKIYKRSFKPWQSMHVLVAVGPAARWSWQFIGEGCDNQHMNAVCMFCLEFALHGSCEHTQVAFVDAKQLSCPGSWGRLCTPYTWALARLSHIDFIGNVNCSTTAPSRLRPREWPSVLFHNAFEPECHCNVDPSRC